MARCKGPICHSINKENPRAKLLHTNKHDHINENSIMIYMVKTTRGQYVKNCKIFENFWMGACKGLICYWISKENPKKKLLHTKKKIPLTCIPHYTSGTRKSRGQIFKISIETRKKLIQPCKVPICNRINKQNPKKKLLQTNK